MKKAILFVLLVVLVSGCMSSQQGYISGSVQLNGTAKSTSLRNYTIEVGESFNASNWTTIGVTLTNSTVQVIEDILGVWNTSLVDEGNYTIRLSVTDSNNVSSHDYLYVTVENVLLSTPENQSDIRLGNIIQVNGSVGGASFQKYAIVHGYGQAPTSWSTAGVSLTANGGSIVDNDVLGTWNTSAVNQTGQYIIKLIVNYTTNTTKERNSTINLNNYLTGWPKFTDAGVYSSPSLSDFDGDGDLEIVIGSHDSNLYIWHHNGSNFIETTNGTTEDYNLSSAHPYTDSFDYTWNITMAGYTNIAVHFDRLETESTWDYVYILNGSNQSIESFSGALNNTWSKSVAGDTISVRLKSDTYVTAWGFSIDSILNGTVDKPWPKNLRSTVYSSPAVGDITGDGEAEIIVGSYKLVHAFYSNGSNLSGWPQKTESWVDATPLLADLDNDNIPEIIVGSSSTVYVYYANGSNFTGWPQNVAGAVYSSASSADLNGDGYNEIIVGANDNRLYVWYANGTSYPGWPYYTSGVIRSSPAVGDLDLDGSLEIIVASYDGRIYAFEENGSSMAGWPVATGAYIYSSPTLADLNGDNFLEVIVTSTDDKVYVLTYNGSNYGEQHNGNILDYSLNSTHPYTNSFDYTWTITVAGFSSIAVHFDRLEVEAGYDHMYILNSSGGTVQDYSGSYSDVWSASVAGDTIRIRLVSDSSVTEWGFAIDEVINGSVVRPWPKDTQADIFSSAVVGDINGDGISEIVVGGNRKINAWLLNGSDVSGFPKSTNGSTYSTPYLTDIDGDGDLDIILASLDYKIYIWDESEAYNSSLIEWGMFRKDLTRTGYYPLEVPTVTLSSPADDATSYQPTVLFSYTPLGSLNLSNCSAYTNTSGAWSQITSSSNITWGAANNLSYDFSVNGTILWSIRCYNTIGQYAFAAENRTLNLTFIPTTLTSITASNITNNSAIISWTSNVAADSVVEYGADTSYGSTVTNASTSTNHTITLAGLTAGTLYHYRVNSTSIYNVSVESADYNITTAVTHAEVVNFTANQSTLVNASQLNATIEFTTNSSVNNVAVILSSTVHNPTSANFSVLGLNRFLDISAPDLEGLTSSIMLRMYYTDEEVNSSLLNESTLGFYWHNTSVSQWQRLNTSVGWMSPWVYDTGVNTSDNYVWANISHLSTYTVGGSLLAFTHFVNLVSGWNMISFPLEGAQLA